MKFKMFNAALTGLIMLLPATVMAVPFSLYNTGVDDDGNALAAGAVDTHYLVSELGSPDVTTDSNVLYYTAPYESNTSTSQWIWEDADGTPTDVVRRFTTTFDLTGYDHSTAVLSGFWGTDNCGWGILINGVDTGNILDCPIPGAPPTSNFTSLHAFTVSSGFVAGINTLEFIIEDLGYIAAFRTDGLAINAEQIQNVPEPSAILLLSLALILIGFRTRIRK